MIPFSYVLRRRMLTGGVTAAVGELGEPALDSDTGLITVEVTKTGVIPAGTTKTLQLSKQAAKTVTPTLATQTLVAKGKYTTGAVKLDAMPAANKTPMVVGTFTVSTAYSRSITGLAFEPIGVMIVAEEWESPQITGVYDVSSSTTTNNANYHIFSNSKYSADATSFVSCSYGTNKVTLSSTSETSTEAPPFKGKYHYIIWGANV